MHLTIKVFCCAFGQCRLPRAMYAGGCIFYGVGRNESVDSYYKFGMVEGFNEHFHSIENKSASFSANNSI